MANVNQLRSRGQLIIITGLMIAVVLVALTLLLNTAIYTENLASRGTAVGGEDALEFRQTSEDTVASLMASVNAQEHDAKTAVIDNVSDGISSFDQTSTERFAEVGTSVNITNTTLHNGMRLRQTNSTRNLTSKNFEKTNWQLASDTENLREFAMEFHSLNETDDPENDSFVINISDGGGDTWNLFVYNNSSDSNNPTLAVTNASESNPIVVCELDDSFPLQLNLTAATVNGEYCTDLEFTKSVDSPYDVKFTRGGDATGTYNLTVNGSTSASIEFNDVGGDSPYEFHVVYSVHFDVTFETEKLTYGAQVRVARGEPR